MPRRYFAAACVSFFSLTFLLASCMEELDDADRIGDITFAPEIGFPLVNSTFTMKEFLTEGGSKAKVLEQSGIMVLTYDRSIVTPDVATIFAIPDQQSPVISIAGSDVTFPSPGGSVTVSKDVSFTFNLSAGDNLDSILFKSGSMLFSLTSTFPANIELVVSIPSLESQGTGFLQNASFAGAGTLNPSSDLQGTTLDLTVGGTTTNTITFAVTATITDTGQAISATDRLDCTFDMTDLGFRGLYGNIGTRVLPLKKDSINVDIFGEGSAGGIELLSPAVRLDIKNSFGLPIGFDIQNVAVIEQDASVIQLSGPAASAPANPYLLNGPSYSEQGQSIASQIEMHSDNSNIAELFSSLPYYLEYQFGAVLDPPDDAQNFVLDTSRLAIGVHLELPFHGTISALTISEDYLFDGLGIEDIREAIVKVRTVNELPMDAAVQVYFADGDGVILDSLFKDRSIIEGAQVGADGFTQDNAEVITEVAVSQEKFDRINAAERLLVRAELHTTDQGSVPVKFAVTDKLQISISLHGKAEYKLN